MLKAVQAGRGTKATDAIAKANASKSARSKNASKSGAASKGALAKRAATKGAAANRGITKGGAANRGVTKGARSNNARRKSAAGGNSGDRDLARSRGWRDRDHDGDRHHKHLGHADRHHHHHFRNRRRSNVFVGLGFGGFGFSYARGGWPYRFGGWPYGIGAFPYTYSGFGWPYFGYGYPYGNGFGISLATSRFGFSYGAGYAGYASAWPYYAYDPLCSYVAYAPEVYSPPVIIDSGPQIIGDPVIVSDPAVADPAITADSAVAPPPVLQTPTVQDPAAAPAPDEEVDSSADEFAEQGVEAFAEGDYKTAIRAWRHALLEDPRNGILLLMLGQALFELDNYDEAAGAVQQGMLMLSEDQYGTVVKGFRDLYAANSKDYVEQLKALEKEIKESPKSPAPRFLVGYHYFYLGYPTHAKKELENLMELAPKDQIGKKLLDLVNKKIEEDEKKKASMGLAPATPAAPAAAPPPGSAP